MNAVIPEAGHYQPYIKVAGPDSPPATLDTTAMHRRTLLGAAAVCATTPAHAAPAPLRTVWTDTARNRQVPVLIRLPAQAGLAPTVLLSHGLGGSRDGLAYLGIALAEAGYVAIHLQHKGSDAGIWQGAPDGRAGFGAALSDVGAAVARLGDVGFALDHIEAGAEPLLAGRVDMARVGIAGHSYGAWTVTHLLGERLPLGTWGLRLPEPRLRAGVALSPIPPLGVPADLAFGNITSPILHVTGTRDNGMGAPDWQARTVGYRTASAPGLLAVLDGAAHASFAGEAEVGGHWNDPTYQPRTAGLARLFLDSVLRGDGAARTALLRGDGLGPRDKLESKGMA